MNLANLKFTPGNILDQVAALQARVDALERDLRSPIITPTNGVFTGDVYNVAWTDYSSDSTIVGWSSFTTKEIFYKKVGKLVFVDYFLSGTSDATGLTFTVPFAANASPNSFEHKPARSIDNGSQLNGTSFGYISGGLAVVTFHPTEAAGNWTASGTKRVVGEFWYEAA